MKTCPLCKGNMKEIKRIKNKFIKWECEDCNLEVTARPVYDEPQVYDEP